MIDLHCHILPYVDDGAGTKDVALKMLRAAAAQDVHEICLTPHLRTGMFETPDDEIRRQFERLRTLAGEEGLKIGLHLSREYYADAHFLRRLSDRNLLPIGENTLLMEFSEEHSYEEIRDSTELALDNGYRPLIAHIERYRIRNHDPESVRKLVQTGCLIQVNADSILGYDGFLTKRYCSHLIRQNLVCAVASDAHGEHHRPVRLKECYLYLTKKFGQDTADRLMIRNPAEIIVNAKNKSLTSDRQI